MKQIFLAIYLKKYYTEDIYEILYCCDVKADYDDSQSYKSFYTADKSS